MTSISVTVHDEDPAIADRLTRQLRAELLALDIDDATFDTEGHEEVSGAKGLDPQAVTTIIVALAGSPVLKQLGRVLQDFVNRDRHREITVKRGKDTITIKGTPDEGTRDLVEKFFDAED
ncbi:hypothetical protein [Actinocrispum sp. NPDC049592]|uniref:hypothetical protein n=1 Tax=Actinocrispum sp. NPDC049592 TaxID=3154835 RepID=UPI00344350FB